MPATKDSKFVFLFPIVVNLVVLLKIPRRVSVAQPHVQILMENFVMLVVMHVLKFQFQIVPKLMALPKIVHHVPVHPWCATVLDQPVCFVTQN